jgi:hypothetical protein
VIQTLKYWTSASSSGSKLNGDAVAQSWWRMTLSQGQTMVVYSHVLPDMQREAADKIDAFFVRL